MALPGSGVLVLRRNIARQVFELLNPKHQHAVIAARLDLGHGAEYAQGRRGTGALMAHGGHAPQLGHHLRHHGAQMRLLALQLAKGIAHVDAGYRSGFELTGRQRA